MTDFDKWLDQFILETRHYFGFGWWVRTIDGVESMVSEEPYKKWEREKRDEFNKKAPIEKPRL